MFKLNLNVLNYKEEESIENCLRSPTTQLPEHLEQLRYAYAASHRFVINL